MFLINTFWRKLWLKPFIFEGSYYQIITSMFLHGSLLHLAMNMVVLYQFGSMLERFLGKVKFSIFYIGGGVLTNIFSLFWIFYKANNGIFINTIGASG